MTKTGQIKRIAKSMRVAPSNGEPIGLVFKKRREQLGLTQRDLAMKLGVSAQLVSNWERCAEPPPIQRLGEIADILKICREEVVQVVLDQDESFLKKLLLSR